MYEAFQALSNKLNKRPRNLQEKRSEGLGDTIAKFTEATGIKAAVDLVSRITKKPCGCKKRQQKLNQMFPYKIPSP